MINLKSIKPRQIYLSSTNQYNDYYHLGEYGSPGDNKLRPMLILQTLKNNQYFLVCFGSTKAKATYTIKIKGFEFHFNVTDTYFFDRKLIMKAIKKFYATVNRSKLFDKLLADALRLGQHANEIDPFIIAYILFAVQNNNPPLIAELISYQFPKPTIEEIVRKNIYHLINQNLEFNESEDKELKLEDMKKLT